MTYENGNKTDKKHYWLTPPELMEKVIEELGSDFFDPAPFPKPEDYNGLESEWGEKNYVNPPFGGFKNKGKRMPGVTAWARKAIAEFKKGKKVVFVFPIDKWVFMMLAAGAEMKNMGDVKWLATEDGSQGKGTGRHVAMFILDPNKKEK